jgi:hypothetical protein
VGGRLFTICGMLKSARDRRDVEDRSVSGIGFVFAPNSANLARSSSRLNVTRLPKAIVSFDTGGGATRALFRPF